MLTIQQVVGRVNALRYRSASRDQRNGDVQMVRQGKISQVYPNFFPDGIDQNVVANFIDIVARDLSEVIAPDGSGFGGSTIPVPLSLINKSFSLVWSCCHI